MTSPFEFSVASDPKIYDDSLVRLRESLADPAAGRIEGIPSLIPEIRPGGTLQFFDATVRYIEDESVEPILVRIRKDNLYLIGYKLQNAQRWKELAKTDDKRLIPGSEALGIGENYTDLTRVADVKLVDLTLGFNPLLSALQTLATAAATEQKKIARAILTFSFTIAEAARFRRISASISGAWHAGLKPTQEDVALVKSWATLSTAVQRTRNEGHTFDFNGEKTDIWDFVSAILALGIMHVTNSSGATRLVSAMTNVQQASTMGTSYPQGQPLLEIFSVRVKSVGGKDPGNLHGAITVTDCAGDQDIWKRDQGHPVSIRPGENLLLEGPRRALLAADALSINVSLNPRSGDDAAAKDAIDFDPFDYFTAYDAINDRDITVNGVSLTVSYIALADALYAQIDVVLVDGHGKNPASVYGTITTYNTRGQSELFRRQSGEPVSVRPQSSIPLSRTVVAVPTRGVLRLDAHLWDHNDEIAAGSVEFQPQYKKSQKNDISGKYGKVEVKVSWM
ncbi:hypothetical protein VTH06DRAFT_5877 [Thermothelomyces fergusii]